MTRTRTWLLLGLLHLFVLGSCAINVPTFQLCGTPDQLFEVTTYPYSISANRNEMLKNFVTWSTPGTTSKVTLRVQGIKEEYVETFLDHYIPNLHETRGNISTPLHTYSLENSIWDNSGIKTGTCEGYYQRTILPNNAGVELIWEVFNYNRTFESGGLNFTAKANVPKLRVYITNYPYEIPGESTPTMEYIYGLGYSVQPEFAYENWYGESRDPSSGFPPDPFEPNVTLAPGVGPSQTTQQGIPSKVRGYNISDVNNNYQYVNYGYLNGEIHTKIFVRGLAYTVGDDTRPTAFQTFFTYYSHDYTGVNDTLYHDIRLQTEATITRYESTSGAAFLSSSFLGLLLYLLSVLF